MTVSKRFVVISGIPGCGKSTIGRALQLHGVIRGTTETVARFFVRALSSVEE